MHVHALSLQIAAQRIHRLLGSAEHERQGGIFVGQQMHEQALLVPRLDAEVLLFDLRHGQ